MTVGSCPAGRRVILLGLDGFDIALADKYRMQGRMPNLERLAREGASYRLDHGAAKDTGLAWEHVSTGLSPEVAQQFSAVRFDPARYAVNKHRSDRPTFTRRAGLEALIFDAPYFDLHSDTNALGLVNWGAHDPGVAPMARPAGLRDEIAARFGPYPAPDHIYAMVWQSAEKTRAAADCLERAVDVRTAISTWLLTERFADWTFAYFVASELHSASEALWHGVDPDHPLADIASAEAAAQGMVNIHQAIDQQIGAIRAACPDAVMIVFNLHGMGRNGSDIASMVLLPELLFRLAFGKPKIKPGSWSVTRSGVPLLADGEDWHRTMRRLMPSTCRSAAGFVDVLVRTLRRNGPGILPSLVRRLVTKDCEGGLGWMPATRYCGYWPLMDAFALPSFYDGRLRVSLAGREANGSVSPAQYGSCLDKIEECLRACTDPLTGKPVIATIKRPGGSDPLALHATDADIIVTWADGPLGFNHPVLGRIGPLPFRRPGGHSGRYGAAYFHGPGIPARDGVVTSAFNVVPTAIALAGRPLPADLSGADLGVIAAS